MAAQAGVVGDISLQTSNAATGGRAWMDSSGWTINRYPKQDPLTALVANVPWWVWAAGIGAAGFWLMRKKRG